MFIVLVFWHIKKGSEDAFFTHWKTIAKIENRTNIAGEFLSFPIPQADLGYEVQNLDKPGDENVVHFVNVGLWKDEQSFSKEIKPIMGDDKPPLPFEARKRTRIALTPRHWRTGEWNIHETDSPGVI